MILPTGTADGPFVSNSDSECGDKSYTLLKPGTDGGVMLGTFQGEPSPAFDASGNSLADHIIEPAKFFGVNFSASTNESDPQTKTAVSAPSLSVGDDGSLSGDLRSFAASWNNQEFNQGAPKPDGSAPGLTAAPSGTLDSQSGAYTLEWRSQIVGGPFDRFTGVWHLEGTFSADATPTTTAAGAGGDQSGVDTADGTTVNASPSTSATTTSTNVLGAPASSPTSSGGTTASPKAVKSPSVVIARSSGGSSGKGWVAIPAALGALVVGGLAIRFRLKQRGTAS
jgi:hypothetical protein